MRKLAALVSHIMSVTAIPPENVYAFADQGDLYPLGRDLGPLRPEPGEDGSVRRQIELGLFRYEGVIQIERYPGDGAAFAALITSWLMTNDLERDGLSDPRLTVELNIQGGDADVEVSVEFEERLAAIEDPAGNIPFGGKLWSLAPAALTPAEEFALKAVNEGAGQCP